MEDHLSYLRDEGRVALMKDGLLLDEDTESELGGEVRIADVDGIEHVEDGTGALLVELLGREVEEAQSKDRVTVAIVVVSPIDCLHSTLKVRSIEHTAMQQPLDS